MGSNLVRRLTQDPDAETTPLRDRWAYQYDIDVSQVAEVLRSEFGGHAERRQ